MAQSLAEIIVPAEKGGISRADFLEFLNGSVMGSMFTRYKTPAYVNPRLHADVHARAAPEDFDLGFDAARGHGVPMPVAAAAAELVRGMHGAGYDNVDFAALLEIEARNAGLDLRSEDADVGDGPRPAEGDQAPVSARA